MIGHVVAVLLSLWNWRRYDVPDPASVVLPVGLIISLAVVLLLLHTGW